MHTKFKTKTVKGHGRGKKLGFPTVNMVVPENIPLIMQQGVYAARAKIKDEMYNGALYYGTSPTFDEKEIVLEIYLLDTVGFYLGPDEIVEVEVVKFIRGVESFGLPELLILQMKKDVAQIQAILKK